MASEAPQLIVLKRVLLKSHHLSPEKAVHKISDSKGVRPFPPFQSLEIGHYPDSTGYYLFYLCENSQGTDTWHKSLEDALHQAEWEFGVRLDEWTDTLETFG